MLPAAPIETQRLILRPLNPADAGEDYVGWMRDPDVLRFLETRHLPRQDAASLAGFINAANAAPGILLYGITLRDSGRHIGNIKLGPLDIVHRRADLGFLIGARDCWGRGYASEAIAATATMALADLKLMKVTAGCYAENVGSARALEKAGFVLEARLKAHWLLDGKPQDGLLYARHADGVAA